MAEGLLTTRLIKTEDFKFAKVNNKFTLSGVNPSMPNPVPATADDSVVYFIEYVDASGAWTLKDRAGTTLFSSIATPTNWCAGPFRINGAFTITGTVNIAFGFFVKVK